MINRETYCKDCDRSIHANGDLAMTCDTNIEDNGYYNLAGEKCYYKIVNGKRAENIRGRVKTMREILFRGKRVDNGEWVEGYYYKAKYCRTDNDLCAYITVPHPEQEGKPSEHFMVIPESVSQFCGLCDKNGKMIFEGDILDCGDRIVFVKWHEQCGTWDCDFIRYKGNLCSNGISPVDWKYRANIIGNIHDNPELLKGGAE